MRQVRIVNLELVILGKGGEDVVSKISSEIINHLLTRTDGIMEETASGASNLKGDDFTFKIISTIDGEEVNDRSELEFNYSNDECSILIEHPQSRRPNAINPTN